MPKKKQEDQKLEDELTRITRDNEKILKNLNHRKGLKRLIERKRQGPIELPLESEGRRGVGEHYDDEEY